MTIRERIYSALLGFPVTDEEVNGRSVLTAFRLGFQDGWEQPHYLSSSWNVEHLPGDYDINQNALDIGINWGQRIRSPFHHQRLED